MKKVSITLLLMLAGFLVSYGQADESRMDRDINVCQDVLQSLMRQEFQQGYRFGGFTGTEAEYLENEGVIFRVRPDNMLWDGRGIYGVSGNIKDATITLQRAIGDAVDDEQIREKAEARRDKMYEEQQEKMEGILDRYQQVATNFLADYAHLLSQLKDNEQVIVQIKLNRMQGFFVSSGCEDCPATIAYAPQADSDESMDQINLSVPMAVISKYHQEKISREAFESEIDVERVTRNTARDANMEIFASALDKLFDQQISKTYFISSPSVSYERLSNLGAIFNVKVYSSNINGKDSYSMPTQGTDDMSKEERNTRVKKLYPEFIDAMKDALVDYGRIINSLDEDDSVVIRIRMTECEDCGLPEKVELSVKMSDLKGYDMQKLSRDAVKDKIRVKETE
ncbi:MAG: hypothetical protein KDC28_10330 [Saprospiraceae bacterium]|nr:hypothetical protein [Saprospiraceae bacterium]